MPRPVGRCTITASCPVGAPSHAASTASPGPPVKLTSSADCKRSPTVTGSSARRCPAVGPGISASNGPGGPLVEGDHHRPAGPRVAIEPGDGPSVQRRRPGHHHGPRPPQVVVAGRPRQAAPHEPRRCDQTGRAHGEPRVVLQSAAQEGPGPRRPALPQQHVERRRRGVGDDGGWTRTAVPGILDAHGDQPDTVAPRPPGHDDLGVDCAAGAGVRQAPDLDTVVLDDQLDDVAGPPSGNGRPHLAHLRQVSGRRLRGHHLRNRRRGDLHDVHRRGGLGARSLRCHR